MLPTGHFQFCTRRLLSWWAVLFLALALTARGDGQTYIVERHDTLYGIARRHGISMTQLAERNGLTKNARVFAGQHLIVPSKSPPASTARPAVGASLQKTIDQTPVTPGRWKYIVIHHSGVAEGTVKGMDDYHRRVRHMEHGLAYHFVIGNGNGMRDGEIAIGERWRKQHNGGHLASEKQNTYSLGICLVGNFDNNRPSALQMQSLTALMDALMKRCKLSTSAVKTHQQINVVGTRCPGRYFPTGTFLRRFGVND